jgi:hypothetical protein
MAYHAQPVTSITIRPYSEHRSGSSIRHIFVSSRYASSAWLAISSVAGNKQIVIPMKTFSVDKQSRVVEFLRARAPQARIDHNE